jgi:hypothetical protein
MPVCLEGSAVCIWTRRFASAARRTLIPGLRAPKAGFDFRPVDFLTASNTSPFSLILTQMTQRIDTPQTRASKGFKAVLVRFKTRCADLCFGQGGQKRFQGGVVAHCMTGKMPIANSCKSAVLSENLQSRVGVSDSAAVKPGACLAQHAGAFSAAVRRCDDAGTCLGWMLGGFAFGSGFGSGFGFGFGFGLKGGL